jgi:hypothetical protein
LAEQAVKQWKGDNRTDVAMTMSRQIDILSWSAALFAALLVIQALGTEHIGIRPQISVLQAEIATFLFPGTVSTFAACRQAFSR